MLKVITLIRDYKLNVFYRKEHEFNTKAEMDNYKKRLKEFINDSQVVVSFTTYIKERP